VLRQARARPREQVRLKRDAARRVELLEVLEIRVPGVVRVVHGAASKASGGAGAAQNEAKERGSAETRGGCLRPS
jgi:hypothetical protein